jgi:hypothetical protein
MKNIKNNEMMMDQRMEWGIRFSNKPTKVFLGFSMGGM